MRMVTHNESYGEKKARQNHRTWCCRLARKVWTHYNGPIPKGCEIHHMDGNPDNNNIGNLICVSFKVHRAIHRGMPQGWRSMPRNVQWSCVVDE
jgi:hypothetical protein